MMRDLLTQRALTVGVALSLAAAPALAASSTTPGFIWIGQASDSTGTNGTGAAGASGGPGATGNVGATNTGAGSVAAPGTATGDGNAGSTGPNNTNSANSTTTPSMTAPGAAVTTGTGTNGVGSSQSGQTGTAGTDAATGAQGSLPLPGSSGGPQTFDLPQTIAAALKSSADVQTATRNVEIDRKRADEAAAQGRPNVGASGSATRYDQSTKISIGGSPPIQIIPTHQELLTINVSNRFDLTGQIRAAQNQAQLQSLADQFILYQIRNTRILRAQTIYFNTLRARHQVDVAQATLINAQRQQTDAYNLNQAGVGQKIDLLRAMTQVETAQQNLTAAQNNLSIAVSSFNDLVGRPLDAPVELSDPPGVIIQQPVTDFSKVGAPDAQATPPLQNAPDDVKTINVTRSLQTAYAQRPEILNAQVNVRVAETGIKLARAGLEPTFSLSAAGNYYPTTSFQSPRQRTAQITATLNIPLYDGGATRDRVQEARLRTENASTILASTQSDVALDVRQAYLNLATAAQQIAAANAALQSAIAARQLAELRYQGQVGLYLEVTDAQAALVQAENNQVDSIYNYLVARAQFQNAVGTPQVQ